MCTVPPLPLWHTALPSTTGTITRLGAVWPATKLRFGAIGNVWPGGYTVRNPAPVGAVTVTLRTSAPIVAGAGPPGTGTGSTTSLPDGTGVVVATPMADRVSRTLVGDTA